MQMHVRGVDGGQRKTHADARASPNPVQSRPVAAPSRPVAVAPSRPVASGPSAMPACGQPWERADIPFIPWQPSLRKVEEGTEQGGQERCK